MFYCHEFFPFNFFNFFFHILSIKFNDSPIDLPTIIFSISSFLLSPPFPPQALEILLSLNKNLFEVFRDKKMRFICMNYNALITTHPVF